MPDLAFDLRYLRYAFLVAQHGSFRAAAEKLNLSQSTVSRRIMILERRLGLILFERGRNGASLTIAGERFIRDAGVWAAQFHQTIRDAQLVHQGETGEIRIGLMTSLTNGFLAELVEEYHRAFPKVQLRIEETSTNYAAIGLASGRIDIAFLPWEPDIEGCRSVPLWSEDPFLAVARDHWLSGGSVATWDDIRSETFLLPMDLASFEIHQYLFRHLASDRTGPRVSPQHAGRENLLNMVGSNLGVLFIPSSALGTEHPRVRVVAIAEGPPAPIFSGVWSVGNRNPALKKFVHMAIARAGIAAEYAT